MVYRDKIMKIHCKPFPTSCKKVIWMVHLQSNLIAVEYDQIWSQWKLDNLCQFCYLAFFYPNLTNEHKISNFKMAISVSLYQSTFTNNYKYYGSSQVKEH